ncbi:MAG TPA: hypothetical protein VEO54_30855 [Thermoanaerobaculia bacterium]|nr:hypothetical protein [Thermoanaerobaculia bacterium]
MTRIVLALLALFFGAMLVPHFVPAAGETVLTIYYLFAVLAVLLLLLGCAVLWLFVRRKALLAICFGGWLLFAAMLGASLLYARGLPTGSFVRRFDAAAWKSSRHYVEGDITPRQKMLGAVVRDVLPGRTKAEIVALLGPPVDDRSWNCDLTYVTGPERTSLFAIDSEWLLIDLDEQGKFERYRIATD